MIKMDEGKKKRLPGQKRKGLGGLSPEKKRMLKQLIMQKAAEEMKAEENRRAEARESYLKTKLPPLKTDISDENQLKAYVKDLHSKLSNLEADKYDWEVKLRRQEYEINDLNLKVNDVKGKFVKPVLKKVNKTESKLAKFEKKRDTGSLASFRNQLKSTSSHKYALEEKEEGTHKNPDWRDQLKPSKDEHGPEHGEGEEGEGGEPQETQAEATLEIEE